MIMLVGAGLAKVFELYPVAHTVLKYTSCACLIYLAWKIAISAPPGEKAGAARTRPMTFIEAALFQWVNPKAWTMALTAVSAYTLPADPIVSLLVVAAVFGAINLPSAGSWTLLGTQLRGFLSDPKRLRIFNVTMALILLATLYPVLFGAHQAAACRDAMARDDSAWQVRPLMRRVILLAGIAATACTQAVAQDAPLRTPWGAPDLQALWSNMTATPLERPPAFDSLTTTDERAEAFEHASRNAFLSDESDGIGGRQSEWWEIEGKMTRIDGVARTSLIVEPANGRLPYSDAGRVRLQAAMADNLHRFDDPETRPATERCLVGGSGSTGAPIFMGRYNTHYRFVQTADHLVIAMEQNNNVRIIPITDKPQPDFRRWMGVSRAHWEGESLVVETAGFMPGDAFKPAAPILVSDSAHVAERFTRLSEGELLYEYTVVDPETFTQTWRVQQVFLATDGPMFETACHENNHSLPNILGGGREIDRAVARKP